VVDAGQLQNRFTWRRHAGSAGIPLISAAGAEPPDS
jgi:hypothetical protein